MNSFFIYISFYRSSCVNVLSGQHSGRPADWELFSHLLLLIKLSAVLTLPNNEQAAGLIAPVTAAWLRKGWGALCIHPETPTVLSLSDGGNLITGAEDRQTLWHHKALLSKIWRFDYLIPRLGVHIHWKTNWLMLSGTFNTLYICPNTVVLLLLNENRNKVDEVSNIWPDIWSATWRHYEI